MATNKPPRASGLFLGAYVLAALAARLITVRQAILLAIVDKWCNPQWNGNNQTEPVLYRDFRIDYLCQRLHISHTGLRQLITSLAAIEPTLLRAERVHLHWWRLSTPKRSKEHFAEGGLYVPNLIHTSIGMGEGKLTPAEAIVLAMVVTFTRAGQLCYLSNKTLGKALGVKPDRAKDLVLSLVRKNWLKSELLTKTDLYTRLRKEYTNPHYSGSGTKTARLLTPTKAPLLKFDPYDPDEREYKPPRRWNLTRGERTEAAFNQLIAERFLDTTPEKQNGQQVKTGGFWPKPDESNGTA